MIGDSNPGALGGKTDATSYLGLVGRSLGLKRDSPWVMLAAYFDESGTHAGSNFLVVAGLISTVERWESLTDKWTRVLSSKDLPAFHTVDCAHRRGAFEGWDARDCASLYHDLVQIVCHEVLWRTWTVLVMPDYHQFFAPENRDEANYYAYGMCLSTCANRVRNVVAKDAPPIPYALERGGLGGKFAMRLFDEGRDLWRVGAVSVDSRDNLVPLQPADMHAYEVHKYFTDQVDTPRIRKSFRQLMRIREAGGGGNFLDGPEIKLVMDCFKDKTRRTDLKPVQLNNWRPFQIRRNDEGTG